MALYEQVVEEIKVALKAKEQIKLTTLRALKNSVDMAVKSGQELNDNLVLKTVQIEIKRRREAASIYQQGKAADRAAAELQEADILAAYLPQQMEEEEITTVIETAVKETQASGIQDMGKVMAQLKDKLANQVDMGEVAKIVKERLSS